jgi:ribosomal protein L28
MTGNTVYTPTMSRICELCGKSYMKGNLVPRGIGRRVTRRTIKRQHPNLRSRKFDVDGRTVRMRICASCLKRIKKEKKEAQSSESEVSV